MPAGVFLSPEVGCAIGIFVLQHRLPALFRAKFRFVQIGGGTANYTALTGAQTNTTVLSGAEVVKFTRLL